MTEVNKDIKPNRNFQVDLPTRVFLYTLDQIATMLGIPMDKLKQSYIYFVGFSKGIKKRDWLEAINIAPLGEPRDWRVNEGELLRWMRVQRIRPYGRRSRLVEGR